jgi:signal transduction histidine kinase/DNA-binding NarL/FixJ family response regulator
MKNAARNIRVLVVEDESIIASDIEYSLNQLGYTVVGTEVSGSSAIAAATARKPDIVLMDIVLQDEMDGIEAAGIIRAKLNIPVIYLSAYAEDKVLERAKLTDPFGYLIKPFDNNELHFGIQMGLYKFRTEEELRRVNRALKTLSSCNHALVHATDESELVNEICRIIVEVGGYASTCVLVPSPDDPARILTAASAGSPGLPQIGEMPPHGSETDDCPVMAAFRSGMPISLQEITEENTTSPCVARSAGLGFASLIALPLVSSDGTFGVLSIFSTEPLSFDPDEFDLLVDLAGNLAYWIISIRNRMARREAEAALQLSHERFLAVMDSLDAVVYVSDMVSHELLFANKYVRDNFPCESRKLCWQVFQDAAADGPCAFCTNKFLLDSGGRPTGVHQWEYGNPVTGRWYDIRDRAIRWVDGRMVRLEIATDMTNRKTAEEELRHHREHLEELVEERTIELTAANRRLMREMSERKRAEGELVKAQKLESMGILAGGIAHDFNNILTSILGNISLAKMYATDEEVRSKLVTAEKTTLRARDLTQQLLTFSRSGVPVKKTSSFVELLKDSTEFALAGSNVRVYYLIPPNVWSIEADPAQIGQVVSNLIINAVQAMPEGGAIHIALENAAIREGDILASMSGNFVRLTVRDEGVGIPRDLLPKIFDPYFTTKKAGSGLGLASTYSIVKKHEGYIFVESELNKGTTFTVYLPASMRPVEKEAAPADEVVMGRGRILVLDDDPGIRDSIGQVLRFLGYTTDFAQEGSEAIDKYREALGESHPYDAVIMDLTIPGGMGGVEAMINLKEMDPGINAIVSSGYSNDPIMSEYHKHGFRGVINKPYQIEDLSRVLARVIRESSRALPNPAP